MLSLSFVVHEGGDVYAAAFSGDVIVYAAEVAVDDALDPAALAGYDFDDDLGAWLDREHERGSAARLVARFLLEV
jgi:hypothetical protein